VVDFVVARILSRIGIDAGLVPRWGETPEEEGEKAGRRSRSGR